MKRLFFIIWPFVYVLYSCQSPVLIDTITVPGIEPVIVVYALLTPADSIEAQINIAYPIGSQYSLQESGVSTARVTLYQGKDSLSLAPSSQPGRYKASQIRFPIRPGGQYQLTVQVNGHPTQRAMCRIPTTAASFTRIETRRLSAGDWQIYKEWKDSDSLETGYAIAESSKTVGALASVEKLYDPRTIKRANSVFFDQTSIYSNPDYQYTSVEPRQFTLVTMDSNCEQFVRMSWQMKDALSTGEANYLFGFKGIIPEFTNIENGLGVFGGYLTTQSSLVYLR